MKHLKEYFDYNEGMNQPHSREMENYMFFQNLHTMKREIDSILALDPSKVDAVLHDGHGWALDHIATSVDDVLEVSNFLKNSVHSHEGDHDMEDKDPQVLVTNIEDLEIEESSCSSCGGEMVEGYCPTCK
jgi:hypothetical protein